ncbi:myotubularin-related protein 9-like isoform X2 [Amblyraja radiata]|uniref:myotubularin-related protein 9-like isoform X2 n=1 Tax=Amblyraja radiata TaxID=386614 RepID=UPI001403C045|nr:myotubularin-related protein 9-like isoform X2 [Amblyraja radiata]
MEFAELIKTWRVDGVILRRPLAGPVKGTLCVSSHHLLLSSRAGHTEELWLLIRNIDAIDKRFTGSIGTITIKCKDFCIWHLEIPGMDECLNIASSIEALLSLESIAHTYPFFYRPKLLRLQEGWDLCSPEDHYTQLSAHTDRWRLSYVNKDFSVCTSYPIALIVPRTSDDAVLRIAATFRHGGRFPVLCYWHQRTRMVILRSSQPLTGVNGRRCVEDEGVLAAALRPGEVGFIIDTRSLQARVRGGGMENKAHDLNWRKLHRPMERGRGLQESLVKLLDACNDPSTSVDRWLSKLEACRWLEHVKTLLTTACLVAQCVDREEGSVLVQGSEGRDATLQVTSLAQVILDPDCRTVLGFQSLLEREWLQAGHPFSARCAASAYSHARPGAESPVFLLFLDGCWQICRQFPRCFQFQPHFLVTLFQHAYASCCGTFLGNDPAQRLMLKVKERTISLWAKLNSPSEREQYLNPLYEPNSLAIWPSVAPQSLQLWHGVFLRWKQSAEHQEEAWEQVQHLMRRKPPATNSATPAAVEVDEKPAAPGAPVSV